MAPKRKKASKKKVSDSEEKKCDSQEKILAIFRQYDTDGNGVISQEELAAVMQKLGLTEAQVATMYKEMDTNSDGVVDYEEFLDWIYQGSGDAQAVLAKGVEKPSLELPPSLEVNGETLPRCLLFQLLAEERCVAVAFYGDPEKFFYPNILVQYAADPDWQVRHGCGQVTGSECGFETYICGVCCEGPPGTPLLPEGSNYLFKEDGKIMKLHSDCQLLRAVGVPKLAKGKGFSVPLVEGDSRMLWKMCMDHRPGGRCGRK